MSTHSVRLVAVALTATATLGIGAVSASAETTATTTAPTTTPATAPAATTAPAAAPTGTLSGIQTKAAAAIAARLKALDSAVTAVIADKNLGSDQAILVHRMQADVPLLQQLGQKIAGDTTASAAAADTATIYSDYRIYALILPSTHLAAAADRIDNATVPKLTTLSSALSARVPSTLQATVAPLLADFNTRMAAAKTATSGVATTVVAYTPAQWNADHQLLASATGSVKTARGEVVSATSDLKQIRADVRGARAQGSTTSPATTALP